MLRPVPKLWNDTLQEHRQEVRGAILEATAALAVKHGVRGVTMLRIAEDTGIGRATLYKYFSDVESILVAWHEHHVLAHLEHLAAIRNGAGEPGKRLRSVLETFALIQHERHGTELAILLHRGEHVERAQQHLSRLICDLLTECTETGEVRGDVAPDELAIFCIHALTAANGLRSKAAVRRLVAVTMAGLHPPP